MLEKILLIVLVALQIFAMWRGGNNRVVHVADKTENEALTLQDIRDLLEERETNTSKVVDNKPVVVRGEFADYMQAGRDKEVYFNGDLHRLGGLCEYGMIQQIEKDYIKVVGMDGKITWLLPRSPASICINSRILAPPTHPASL